MNTKTIPSAGKFLIGMLLFCSVYNYSFAQSSPYKEERTWQVLSSLMGTSLEEATKTLVKYKMAEIQNSKDPELGLHIYAFAKTNAKEPKEEPAYYLCFNESKKVEMISSGYVFSSSQALKEGLAQIEKDLKSTGYNLPDIETEEQGNSFGQGQSKTFKYFFNKPNQKNQVLIMSLASTEFILIVGQKKHLDKMIEMNE